MAKQSGSLRAYAITRLVLVIPMVLILLTIVFILMRVAPGNPVQAALGGHVPESVIKARVHDLGFDKPMIVQYWDYVSGIFDGQFWRSRTLSDNRSLFGDIVAVNGAATLELSVAALIIALILGLGIGLVIGRYRDTWFDVVGRRFGVVTYALPLFFLGIIFILVFSAKLNWLPNGSQADILVDLDLTQHAHTHIYVIDAALMGSWTNERNVLVHLILPAVTLGLLVTGVLVRLVRVNIIQTLRNDYVEAARARGIHERHVVVRHAFRNALVPVVTVVGLQAALLLSGAVLTETTFNWPGIGYELIHYLNNRDYTAVQGIVTVFALVVVVVSLLIDFVNALIDPRVRF
jgi:peptide/nickel transport system permease protein